MGFGEPFRVTPASKVTDMETWGLRPYLRPATCAEFECSAHLKGWRTTVGPDDAAFLRLACAGQVDGLVRHAVEIPQADGFTQFVFEPGQPCLKARSHQVHQERDPIAVRRGGDWRAATTPNRTYDRLDQWTDDLHTSTTKLTELRERHG